MGNRAVYNNQSLMIYITGEHARLLCARRALSVDVYIGHELVGPGLCNVALTTDAARLLLDQLQGERGSIQAVRSALHAAHPEMAGARNRRRDERRKRAKRALSTDVPD